jgi:tetratricopeptide (TPR) repeat protein
VLVGKDGRVRVVDFGLARAADYDELPPTFEVLPDIEIDTDRFPLATPLTQTGAFLGTPQYMAPEQHMRSGADERTDQFAFCVTLYEGLYGRRPFPGRTLGTLARQVTEGRIVEPEDAAVPARFKNVVLRGLAVAPDERFPNMAALLGALAEALAARRRRTVAASAVAGLALLAGLAAFAMTRAPGASPLCPSPRAQLAGVWDVPVRHAVRASFLASARPHAAPTAGRVQAIVDDYAEAWVDARSEACAATHVRGEQSVHLLDLRMACLDRRRQALTATTAMWMRGRDGDVVDHAVATALALPAIASCADVDALTRAVPLPDDEAQRRAIDELAARLAAAQALYTAGKYRDALALADAIARDAREVAYAPIRAQTHLLLALLNDHQSDVAAGGENANEAARQAARARDDNWLARALIEVRNHHFYEDRMRGTTGGARALELDGVLEVAMERVGEDPVLRAEYWMSTGELLVKLDRDDDARGHFERALALRREAFGPDDVRVAETLRFVASTLPDERAGERVTLFRKALAIYETTLGPEHPTVAEVLNSLGAILPDERAEEALAIYDRSRAIFASVFGADDWTVGRAFNNSGEVLCTLGRFEEGVDRLERGVAVYEKAFGKDHCHLAYPLTGLGECYAKWARPQAAVASVERALASCAGQTMHPDLIALARFTLAGLLWQQGGDRARAKDLARQARAHFAAHASQHASRLVEVDRWLADAAARR